MGIEGLRELVARLGASATTLVVLGAELEARTSGAQIDPRLRPFIDDLLRDAGALQALEGVTAAEVAPLLAELKHFWALDNEYLMSTRRSPGWASSDPYVLQSGGEITEGFAHVLPRLFPMLEGLEARFAAGATFLDVGTGVGRLSIAMARKWPSLRAVGLDVWAPSLALARQNVAAAGLQDRVELREQSGADLPDEGAFDLAWIPAPFIPEHVLPGVVERVHRALKPGGWLLFATAKPGEDARGAPMRFRAAMFGGRTMTQVEVERMLADQGLIAVHTLPGPPRDFKMVVAARRAA
jgi:SAM-dependent methyltransferase